MPFCGRTPLIFSESMNNPIILPKKDSFDVWERIASSELPIYIYGTGNGADRILDIMIERGITVSGIFASDGFVRNRVFRGFQVKSYSDICTECDDFAVIIAFGSSRPEVMANVERIAGERTVFCPDVPAVGNTLFNSEFYCKNYDKFNAVLEIWADERSREVYSDIINYKLTGNLYYLDHSSEPEDPAKGILNYANYRSILDLGAYTGDTVRDAIENMPQLEHIIAVEPEPRAFRKLTEYAENQEIKIIPINAAAWDADTTLTFTGGTGRGSTTDADGRKSHRGQHSYDVSALTPDSSVKDRAIDFIKYDVEGAEARALRGSLNIIKKYSPDLLVSLYHRGEDLFELPFLVRELCPDHKLYLRRKRGFPAWDINLYAISEEIS